MRVVSDNTNQLILAHQPRVIPAVIGLMVVAAVADTLWKASSLSWGQWIAAMAGTSVGVLMTYITALPSRVVFDAQRAEVCWQHIGWPGRGTGCCALDDVTSVGEIQDTSSGGNSTRVALYTTEGLIPLTRHFSGTDPNTKNVQIIEKWLAAYQARRSTLTTSPSDT